MARNGRIPWSALRGWTVLWPLALLLVIALFLVLDRPTGIPAVLQLRGQVRQANQRIGRLESERKRLEGEIDGLRSDPFAIESFARDRLGMVRPHEVVIRLDPESRSEPIR